MNQSAVKASNRQSSLSENLDDMPQTVTIPVGSFFMGGIAADKFVSAVELPRHKVHIQKPLAIGKAPVTQRQWLAVMPALPESCPPTASPDCPVVCVTCNDISNYLERLNNHSPSLEKPYRLPSESEWEYACRAGSDTIFPSGNQLSTDDANFLYDERGNPIGKGELTPVSQYTANAFGLSDMLGNVCEWTADHWHPTYNNAPDNGGAWLDKAPNKRRVIRGGAWDHLPRVLRASWRDWAEEDTRWDNLGFRIALDL